MPGIVLYKRTSDITDEGLPKLPTPEQILHGEIAINYHAGVETFAMKNSENHILTMPLSGGIQAVADEIEYHESSHNNPHVVTKEQIGLGLAENTSDANKPITPPMQEVLNIKMNVSDIYNSIEESESIDLSTVPWAASQGYSFKNVLDAYEGQDTSELENRISWCENNV